MVSTYQTATRYRGQQKANILDSVMTNEDGMINSINYEEPKLISL